MSIIPVEDDNNTQRYRLNEMENLIILSGFTIATFYKKENGVCSEAIIKKFTDRAQDIIESNRWLGGKLEKGRDKKLELVERKFDITELIAVQENDRVFAEKPRLCIDTIIKETKHLTIGNTSELIGNGKYLFKVAVTHNCSKDRFLITLSISHAIADGSTIYNLWNMFDDLATVYSLDPVRPENYEESAEQTIDKIPMGSAAQEFLFLWLLLKALWKLVFYPKPRVLCYKINTDEIERIKSAQNTRVSTNDVINSWFFNLHKFKYGEMVMNMRTRVPGCDVNKAGAYINIGQLFKKDFETPATHRKALQGMLSKQRGPFKANWSTNTGGFSTSWTGFYKDVKIEGLVQYMHCPIEDIGVLSLGPIPLCAEAFLTTFKYDENLTGLYIIDWTYGMIDYDKCKILGGRLLD